MPSTKINDSGNYLTFQGVSIISPVGYKNQDLWLQIETLLQNSNLIRKYFALLPLQSYHMTLFNLFTQEEYSSNWPSVISENKDFFQKINQRLFEVTFEPEVSLEYVNYYGAIQLILSLRADQKVHISHLAEEFKIKIPSSFHITLAYEYRPIDDDKITTELSKLATMCKGYNSPLVLTAPNLHFFHDMENFTPWDGKINPFMTLPQVKFFGGRRLLSSKKDSDDDLDTSPPNCTIF